MAPTLNNLARVLNEMGRQEEAELCCRRAIRIEESSFDPDHPVLAKHLADLAKLLAASARKEEAAALYRRALGIWEQRKEQNSQEAVRIRARLAELQTGPREPGGQ